MPSIRLVDNRLKKEFWCPIMNQHVDTDGYLDIFQINYPEGQLQTLHSIRHKNQHIPELSVTIFLGATSLRSAKGLLEDFEKLAAKLKWYDATKYPNVATHIGKAGALLGSAALLEKFLKTRPFNDEGYYTSANSLWLGRLIDTKNTKDYKA